MLIDRAGIAARIPHQGRMCLLDGVLEWDAERIRCCATSHRDPANRWLREFVLTTLTNTLGAGTGYADSA